MCSIVGRLNILSLVAFIKYQLSGLAQAQRYDKNPSNDNRTILVIYKTLWRSRDYCNNKNSSSLLLYSNSNNNNNNSSTFVATISITFACRDLCWQQNLWEIIIWKGTECCACVYMCVKWFGMRKGGSCIYYLSRLFLCVCLSASLYLSICLILAFIQCLDQLSVSRPDYSIMIAEWRGASYLPWSPGESDGMALLRHKHTGRAFFFRLGRAASWEGRGWPLRLKKGPPLVEEH